MDKTLLNMLPYMTEKQLNWNMLVLIINGNLGGARELHEAWAACQDDPQRESTIKTASAVVEALKEESAI